jgi:hypothetical protein
MEALVALEKQAMLVHLVLLDKMERADHLAQLARMALEVVKVNQVLKDHLVNVDLPDPPAMAVQKANLAAKDNPDLKAHPVRLETMAAQESLALKDHLDNRARMLNIAHAHHVVATAVKQSGRTDWVLLSGVFGWFILSKKECFSPLKA